MVRLRVGGDFLQSFQGAEPEAAEGEAGREEMGKLIWGAGARKWPRAEHRSMAREGQTIVPSGTTPVCDCGHCGPDRDTSAAASISSSVQHRAGGL